MEAMQRQGVVPDGLSLCTALVPMADTKDKEGAICQGAMVQVVQNMQSNSKSPVELSIGLKGEVHKIVKDGDALIVEGYDAKKWVKKTNFFNLKVVGKVAETAGVRDQKEPILAGMLVQVLKDMRSSSKNPVDLPIGLKDKVHKIDKEGDALIKFDSYDAKRWVEKAHVCNLSIVENARVAGKSASAPAENARYTSAVAQKPFMCAECTEVRPTCERCWGSGRSCFGCWGFASDAKLCKKCHGTGGGKCRKCRGRGKPFCKDCQAIFKQNTDRSDLQSMMTYTKQISTLGKCRQWAQALEIFEAMQRQGVVPDVITYSALISACEKGKQPERALELFEAMQRQGVVPNVITYNALISACGKGKQPERALELFEAMQRQGVVPDVMPESTLWVLGGIGACTR